ncbi:FecR family protein [Telluribacter sp.]|jgi:ferric-dicitrate binding protein FerR (iron transport regulator)|uniref:FecR family protein n=1 Tax=Telluribacter sp. TaxID=1978767 RepID=UPI002E0EC050|nr:FecR domain-containing protein [Telluribacter sp.]
MEHQITKHILFEYLSGRATPLEKQAVDEWLKREENGEQFHRWLLEWELQQPQYLPDSEAAFSALLQRIDEQEEKVVRPQFGWEPSVRRLPHFNWQVAASITILLCLSGWLLRKPLLYKTYQTDYGQTSAFTLSDGSHVTLNANSSLLVHRFGFDGTIREVLLEGEAEFSVRHTHDNRRFVVRTSDEFQVEVLGTEFSVYARPRGTRVALSRGKIRLDYTEGTQKRQLLMKPGELVTMNKSRTLTLQKIEKPELQSVWKEQRFVFNNTSVQEICALLHENFGLVVRVANAEIANRTITGNFKAQTADDLLDVLKEVLDLQIRKEKNKLFLHNSESSLNPIY